MPVKAHKPIKIEGVTITPKWDWTPQYRKEYGKTLRGQPQEWYAIATSRTPTERFEDTAICYARWLANKRGIDISGSGKQHVLTSPVYVPGRKG